ncbi:hypothetical protein PF003_g10602 [Phytophthora fragariae]|nr:hypothetical protein PF003_g10602 [Phytophthora fragariae]
MAMAVSSAVSAALIAASVSSRWSFANWLNARSIGGGRAIDGGVAGAACCTTVDMSTLPVRLG